MSIGLYLRSFCGFALQTIILTWIIVGTSVTSAFT